MRIRVYQSSKGDCLLLTSAGATPVRVLVDGGMADSYRQHVAADLAKLKTPLDAVYVSHIDDDHIGGVLKMMDDLVEWRVYDYQKKAKNPSAKPPNVPRPPGARKIWHNTFHALVGENAGAIEDMLAESVSLLAASESTMASAIHAEQSGLIQSKEQALRLTLRVADDQLGIAVNPEFKRKLMLINDDAPIVNVGPVKFRLLGPFKQDLDTLRKEWNQWLKASKATVQKIQRDAKADTGRLASSIGRLLGPLTAGADDFARSQVALAKTLGQRQKVTTPNLASLMFLAEEGAQRVLLTGDGHSDDVTRGLKAHGVLDAHGKLHVNVIKVMHHGSEHNITAAFCRDITADDYVFCGNGFSTNPEVDVIATLAEERRKALPAKPFKFWFNSTSAVSPYAAQMKLVRAEVDKQVAQSGGRMRAQWIAGSFMDM